MEEKFKVDTPVKNYAIRATGEEVEVTSFNQPSKGERSEEDWVTYIDKDGVEHIKEHLNMELDFVTSDVMIKYLSELFKPTKFETKPIKFPGINIGRTFEVAKGLYVNGMDTDAAIDKAIEFVKVFSDKCKDIETTEELS